MKKTFREILDGCQPQELDSVLKNIDADLPDETSEERIAILAKQKANLSKKPHTARKIILTAACIALVAAILVGCYVAEKTEYDNAVKFFDLNQIDTEGMSRSDIKRVYRDIDSESFQYEDSYRLLSDQEAAESTDKQSANGSSGSVEGVDIHILNNANLTDVGVIESLNGGIMPFTGYGDVPDGTTYFIGDEFEKNVNGETAWRTKLPHGCDSYYIVGGKALIWGSYIYDQTSDYMHTCVALIDDKDGKILWEKTFDSRYHFDENPAAVLTDDGRIAVLTLATDDRFSDNSFLVFREMDTRGKVVEEQGQPAEGIVFLDRLIPLSDGWLALTRKSLNSEGELKTALMKLSDKGAVTNEWSLSGINFGWYDEGIIDIMEYDGRILLAVQDRKNPETLYDDAKIEDIPENADSFEEGFTDVWRDRAREEFSSVLLVCDPENGKPEQFYSVGGTMALRNSLRTDGDGNLVWSVGRIVKCGWCPWANSFQLYGVTRRYDYTFDMENNLLKQEKTGYFDGFRTV